MRQDSFVKGQGRYVDDITMPNMLHMAVVRSPHARAKIISVRGGLNGKELSAKMAPGGEGGGEDVNPALLHPVLAQDHVNYAGQPVAAVFANDSYSAEDMISEVQVEYEQLKPVITIHDSFASEPIHQETNSNIIKRSWVGEDFLEADAQLVLEDEFMINRIIVNSLEPRGVIADFDGSRLTLWISTQSVHSIKQGLCKTLKLDPKTVRILQADTGGAFGVKGGLYPEYVMAAYASMKYKRPVKWIETRKEHLSSSNPGRGVWGQMKLLAQRDGKIMGLKGKVTADAGAYGGGMGTQAPFFISMQLTGPYHIQRAHILATSVMTNKPLQGPYRGAGRPEAAFFLERMIDLLADETKLEADEVRLLNTTTEPFKSPTGLEIEPSRPFFEKAVEKLGYKEKSKLNAGLGFFVLVPATRSGEGARILVNSGNAEVWLGGNVHGQAHEVFVKKLLNETLGIPEENVTLNNGDSDAMEKGIGSWGSRSAMVGGAALLAAANKIKVQIKESRGEYKPEYLREGKHDAYVFEEQKKQVNAFGANLALVDIDRFGMVKVNECGSYYDVGRALNPDMVVSQIIGGSAQGIGQTLYEGVEYSDDGKLLTSDLFDAGMPIAENMPKHFEVNVVENPSSMPHHARGLGEAPTIGVPLALVRAIERTSGKRMRHTPIKPQELID